ncbi:S13A2-like protein [Mya arenaria]|uniref:S13A2-like protein n=1 Tax=Mya arenaria TaxID=6604 RepID=A0ABY7E1D0_MYAAR|nr:S13A2-like protein [Mya arenaria]
MAVLTFLKSALSLKALWLTPLAFIIPCYLLVYESDGQDPEQATEQQARCAYVIVVMAILWLTEAIPIPVTALMPIFLFPLTKTLPAKTISEYYVTDTTMLFLGGLIIAVALEETGLHTRISLGVLRIIGAQPIIMMLGMMGTTWFLSMWISNTAATAMMIPIITAVVGAVREARITSSKKDGNTQEAAEMNRFAKGLALCVAYGANIGGIATLTGTPPNLVLKDVADKMAESLVLIVFLLLVILWLFRSPPNIDGWGILWMYEETKT